jgi:hypothetical protein
MIRTIVIFALALLTTLTWTHEISATSWDFIYECDKLPDDPALKDKVWEVYKTQGIATSDVCEITAKKELHITDPDNKVCFFMQPVKNAEKATVEARVKVLSQSGVGYTILLGIEDGAIYTWLDLFPDHVQLDGGESHKVDMTDYHILRVARDGNDVTIYVDDEKAIQGQPGGTGDRKTIIFGAGSTAGTGEHYWDYVVFTTSGAFSPKELPNFLSMQAIESRGKVTTCWGTLKYQSQFP